MNVAFFLTPKQDVVWLPAQATLERALEILAPHRYSAVPILDARGGYVGTLTEGDILWHLLAAHEAGRRVALAKACVIDVPRHQPNLAVRIDAEIEALVARAMHQNFVPVIDDRDAFIGIVRRQQIIAYCARAARITADVRGLGAEHPRQAALGTRVRSLASGSSTSPTLAASAAGFLASTMQRRTPIRG